MANGLLTVEPTAIYDEYQIRRALGLTEHLMLKERRDGRIKFARRGRRVYYLGSWIINWMEGDTAQGVDNAVA